MSNVWKCPKNATKSKGYSTACSYIWHVNTSKSVYWLDTHSVKMLLIFVIPLLRHMAVLPTCPEKQSRKSVSYDNIPNFGWIFQTSTYAGVGWSEDTDDDDRQQTEFRNYWQTERVYIWSIGPFWSGTFFWTSQKKIYMALL